MKYEKIVKAVFLERPNRFVARVETKEEGETFAHVPNTGRCKEIFIKGTPVYLWRSDNPKRKYAYTLFSAYKGDTLIHIHSAAANLLVEEGIKAGKISALKGATHIQREKTFQKSRFDFRFQKEGKTCFMEVKGVTLESHGIAMFPDAPTERGTRHLYELMDAIDVGYEAYVLFVIQMKGVGFFQPNEERDPLFTKALREAKKKGVHILAYDAFVTAEEILLDEEIAVELGE